MTDFDDFDVDMLADNKRLTADNQRLRNRIHEAVDECQRRCAPYQRRCDRFDIWSQAARDYFARSGDNTWTHGSHYNRLFIMSLMEERDEARMVIETIRVVLALARPGSLVDAEFARGRAHLMSLIDDILDPPT